MTKARYSNGWQIVATLLALSSAAGCSSQTQGCQSGEAAQLIASEYEDPERLVDAEFEDVLELSSDDRSAICSGKLMVTDVLGERRGVKPAFLGVSVEMDFTWRVQETESGENYFQWVEGRKSASAFE